MRGKKENPTFKLPRWVRNFVLEKSENWFQTNDLHGQQDPKGTNDVWTYLHLSATFKMSISFEISPLPQRLYFMINVLRISFKENNSFWFSPSPPPAHTLILMRCIPLLMLRYIWFYINITKNLRFYKLRCLVWEVIKYISYIITYTTFDCKLIFESIIRWYNLNRDFIYYPTR